MLKDIILSKFVEFANKFPVCELIARESCVWIKEEKMTKIKKALLSIVCCFAVIFCCAFVFTACTDAEYTSYNITIDKAIQSGWVKVQGDAIAGEEITIVLNPDTGYEIVPGSLKVNGKEVVGNKFIMPEGNVNVTAKFKKINYAVNTGNIEHGTVDIEVSAQEIASGDSTEWGAKVTLTPVPEKGYECTGITVLNNGAQVLVTREGNKWSFIMPQGNITINATFEKVTHTLTKQTEHGSFTIPATASFGDIVEVANITADPGYVFSKIKVNGNTITGTSFKMPDSDTTVTVEFKAVEYTVSKNTVDHARIVLSKTKAYYGDTITVSVTPDEGYIVSAIKVNGVAISGNSFVVEGDSVVTVELTAIDYSITVNPAENGSIVPNKTTANVGDLITLTVNPDATYKLGDLIIKNGDSLVAGQTNGNTVTFTMPAGNVTISATFKQEGYDISIDINEGGSVIVNPVTALPGTKVYITFIIDEGYDIDDTFEAGVFFGEQAIEIKGADDESYFIMPDGNVEVRVRFVKETYRIDKIATSNGSFETSAERASIGDTVSITVNPNTGYELDKITINFYADGTTVDLDPGVTSFVMKGGRVEIFVTFKAINYTITREGGTEHGYFDVQGEAQYGEEVVITEQSTEAGYEAVFTVMCDGTPVTVTNNKFIMPAGNVTISVSYTLVSYTISVDEENIENGSVSVIPTIANIGNEVTITVTPNDGYSLKAISVLYDANNDGNYQTLIPAKTTNENEYVFNMIAYNVKIRAWFGIKSSITANEATNGTVEITGVTSELDGTFTENATEAFEGDTVTITATPSTGFVLKSLQVNNGAVATTETSEGVFTFAMPAEAVSVTAEYNRVEFTITKNSTTNGSFSVKETAIIGETVTITATPATGYELDQILVDGVAITGTTFTMPAKDVTVSVTFKAINYTITKNPTTNGSFDVKETAIIGETVTITVTPATGYELNQILVDGEAISGNSFTMPANNVAVSVTFKAISYTITKNTTTNGSFEVKETAKTGETVTITATPATGYELDQILVDGVAITGTTFTMPAKDVTVSVTFKAINYTITKSIIGEGVVNIKTTATYGETVTVTATANTGYVFKSLKINNGAIETTETSTGVYTFVMPAEAVSVTAEYEGVEYTITKNSTTNGSFEVKETAKTGETVTITATPNTGYVVREIKINGSSTGVTKVSDTVYTFVMPANSVQVDVVFGYYVLTASDIEYRTSGTNLTITKVTTDKTSYEIPSTFNIGGKTYSVTEIVGGSYNSIDSDVVALILPNTVTRISGYAFYSCKGLTSITIPSGVTSIGNDAFSGCSGLTSITIPSSVTIIGKWTFFDCTGLTSITIPEGVTRIGNYAFMSCTGLTSIVVAGGNTKYNSGNGANCIIETATNTLIAGCKTTVIPNSVTSIGSSAFNGCKGLTSITIPSSVTSIGERAFEDCTGLTSITIPEGVTRIGNYAFMSCSGLTSITIPSSVTIIGKWTFFDCTGLTSITIPEGVTSIGDSAFRGCTGLTSITIPEGVTSIGNDAFFGCKGLTSITIPEGVTSIGNSAFSECISLTSVTFSSTTAPTIRGEVFMYCHSLKTIYVPAGSKTAYETALANSGFTGTIVEQ